MRVNKWKHVFVIVGRSIYGLEDIDEFDTSVEARKMVKEYRVAMPYFSLSIVKRRVLNEDWKPTEVFKRLG